MTTPTRAGSIIAGKYRVERLLGRGGMGVVVVARHLRLGERVAIKFPVARLSARGDVVVRWLREGRAAMRIRSQHVARVYDIGTLETGEPYLVMEYLVGRDLAAVLAADGPLPVEHAVEYILQACEAIAEAHAQGIIHRDLKPSNLFLTRGADGSAITKVLDFGTAKTLSLALETPLTGPAAVIGTPLFMAPEQMRSRREIDARTDIWALGATLHTLLTGTTPFSAGSILEIHECILRGAPPLRASRPDAPLALEAALLRCMQTEPGDRYASVAELAEALAEVAPEHARISAVRAARILGAAPVIAEPTSHLAPGKGDSMGTLPTASSTSASWPDAEALGTMGKSVASSGRPSPGEETTAPRRRRSHALLVLALGSAIVGGGLDAAVRARGHEPSSPPVAQPEAMAVPAAPSFTTPLRTSVSASASPGSSQAHPVPGVTASDEGAGRPTLADGPSSRLGRASVVRSTRSGKLPDAGYPPPARPLPHDPLADPD
jgi:serine/threonine protein kinase